MSKQFGAFVAMWLLIPSVLSSFAAAGAAPEPTRIVIECEEMQGVNQQAFGPGAGWQVGRWGYDLYQNMVFGGPWASRLRCAMTDEKDGPAEATADIDVPDSGTYKVWVKYECPPRFNYGFGVKIEPLGSVRKPVFDRVYGLRESPKHFCFNDKLVRGEQFWNWGIDHDAAEGHEAKLAKGRYRVTLYKTKNPEPAGARSVDAILITSDLAPLSAPRMPRYPLLDELRRANHVYFRFRSPGTAAAPIHVRWNHWNHRYPDFYSPSYRELVRFYDAGGRRLEGGKDGDWPEPIAPGGVSPWYDLGPTMNTESTSPFEIQAVAAGVQGAKPGAPAASSPPFGVDLALGPSERQIVKSFETTPGEPSLAILVQPDLHRAEGVEHTRKIEDVYREATRQLHAEPRLGPIPKRLRLFAGTGNVRSSAAPGDLDIAMGFREALGINTLAGNTDPKSVPAILQWARGHGGIVERSLAFHHTQSPEQIIRWVRDGGVQQQFYYVSFGDEIGLPAIDVKDAKQVEAFRAFVRAQEETPESLGLAGWEAVKPLEALSSDVAIQIGVLPQGRQGDARGLAGLKRLYWHSLRFRTAQGVESFAAKTRAIRAALGPEVHTSANLGSMHPFYWMHQASFIEAFKRQAMSLAWTEDYTYCMPEGSRLVADFEAAYLRKGASYHGQPMMFYCMPHWPGNTPELLIQNAVLQWGQNVKDLDFFFAGPDIWSTENYVASRGGLPMWRAIRTISGMAGLIEDHLLPARTEPARIAMLLSEASDVWEVEGKGQGAVEPGSVASNVSQEERKAIWYALREAGHRVDVVTEDDCAEGKLAGYSLLYLCGQNLERRAARAVGRWVRAGGTLVATAGAARKDEFDAPLNELDEVLGRGKPTLSQHYRGPLRARLELPWERPLDEVKLASGGTVKVLCSRETFETAKEATVLGRFRDGRPAWIEHRAGQGRSCYTGLLPGLAWLQAGLPAGPAGKGGTQASPWMVEPIAFDRVAEEVILQGVRIAGLRPDVAVSHRGVVTNRLRSPHSTILTVVNLAQQTDGVLKNVDLEVSGLKSARRAWSCFHRREPLPLRPGANGLVLTLPRLAAADVVVIENP